MHNELQIYSTRSYFPFGQLLFVRIIRGTEPVYIKSSKCCNNGSIGNIRIAFFDLRGIEKLIKQRPQTYYKHYALNVRRSQDNMIVKRVYTETSSDMTMGKGKIWKRTIEKRHTIYVRSYF